MTGMSTTFRRCLPRLFFGELAFVPLVPSDMVETETGIIRVPTII